MSAAQGESRLAKFKRKAFVIRSIQDMADISASGAAMHRVLGSLDLVLLGIGCIIGAGIMVLTGVAANKYAGPGVVLSYGISAVAAMLTSFCYAEFAADLPVAGGAFNYIGLTFGEFAAWVAACDLILEYTLSAAAVAKGFTSYFASLIGVDLGKLRLQGSIFTLDFPALLMVVVCSLVLARSTRESSLLNSVSVVAHLALIAFVIFAGFPNVDSANYTPFLPYGLRGAFTGASVVFFSFIGFDTVSTAAEEVKNPARDLPIGIVGSLSVATVLYILMCLVITGMMPYDQIDINAPFSVAFKQAGMSWADKIVSFGALTGILTSLMGSLLGQARIYVTLGRQYLLPAWLARVDPARGTPRNATLLTMFTAGILALFFDIEVLAELVSIGTLVVFAMVCAGVLFRRYHVRGQGDSMRPVGWRLVAIILVSVGFSSSYIERAPEVVPALFLVAWAALTASFYKLPVKYVSQVFACPFQPWIPSGGMLACVHLIGSLGWPAYVRWIIWFCLGSAVYLLYSMHHSQGEGNSRIAAMEMQQLPSQSSSQGADDGDQGWLLVQSGHKTSSALANGSSSALPMPLVRPTGQASRTGEVGTAGGPERTPGSSPPVSDSGTEDTSTKPVQVSDSKVSEVAHRRHPTPSRIGSIGTNLLQADALSSADVGSTSSLSHQGGPSPARPQVKSPADSPHKMHASNSQTRFN